MGTIKKEEKIMKRIALCLIAVVLFTGSSVQDVSMQTISHLD